MEETVRQILADYSSLPLTEIRPDSNLQTDLGLNSLDVINLVVEFEDTFGIEIDEPNIQAFQTVQDLFDYLTKHAPAKQKPAYRYDTVIFDLDGTLLDTLDDLVLSVNEYLAQSGHPQRSREEIRSFLGYGARELVRDALPERISGEELDKAVEDYKQVYRKNMTDSTRPYDGVMQLLKDLKDAGITTAVVSNKPDNSVVDLCREMFGDLVDFAAGDQPGYAIKPDPHLVHHVMRKLGADPETTLYVGDSEVDVQTAKNASVAGAGVTWGFRDRDVLEKESPDYIVDHPLDLEKVVGIESTKGELGK